MAKEKICSKGQNAGQTYLNFWLHFNADYCTVYYFFSPCIALLLIHSSCREFAITLVRSVYQGIDKYDKTIKKRLQIEKCPRATNSVWSNEEMGEIISRQQN